MAAFGRMREASPGKDSVTGHWELMGLVLDRAVSDVPERLSRRRHRRRSRRASAGATLGNVVGSGTEIMDAVRRRAHADRRADRLHLGRQRVPDPGARGRHSDRGAVSRSAAIAYELVVEGLGVGPGHRAAVRRRCRGTFTRTANRHDFACPPRGETLLDRLIAAGVPVMAVGKIRGSLRRPRHRRRAVHTASDDEGMDAVEARVGSVERGLIFANLVDFDTQLRPPQRRRRLRPQPRALRRAAGELLPRLRPTTCSS